MPEKTPTLELYCLAEKDHLKKMAAGHFAVVATSALEDTQGYVDEEGMPRLNILEVQRLIRFMPKAVIAVVPWLGSRWRTQFTCCL